MQLNSFTDVEIYLFQLTIGNSYVVLLFETSNKLQHEHYAMYFIYMTVCRLTV